MADGSPRRLCMSHPSFNGADFCREEMGQLFRFYSSGKQIWNERKIIVLSFWPYIYAKQ